MLSGGHGSRCGAVQGIRLRLGLYEDSASDEDRVASDEDRASDEDSASDQSVSEVCWE